MSRRQPAKARVLVVAWAFAPAAPIGTLRPLRLVRRLAADNWDVTVLMATPSTYGPDVPIDETLLGKVPSGVRIIHAPIWRFPSLPRGTSVASGRTGGSNRGHSGGTAVRGPMRRMYDAFDEMTSTPDNKSGWIVPATTRGLLEILRSRPDVIYSTAPPWSGQIVALALARLTRAPWVADFRDPWARAPWRETQPVRIRRSAEALERRVVERAEAVLFATRTNRDEYLAHYGDAFSEKFRLVPNGCDPEDFLALRNVPAGPMRTLLHAGSLYGQRSPVPIFRAIATALQRGLIDRRNFRLRLIGAVSANSEFEMTARELGLEGVVEFVQRVPRQQIIDEMARATALLVLQPGTTVSIPGKLYEYFAAGKPVLALTEEGELADLVRQSGAGVAVNPNDEGAIGDALVRVMSQHAEFQPAAPHYFDGQRSAADAAAILEHVVDRRKRVATVAVTRES